MRANFVRGSGDYMGVAGFQHEDSEITSPVRSYWANDYGLYNMAGNVNEWVQDVYRPMSFQDVDEFRPFRGNVFTKLVTDEEGNIAQKDELGRLQREPISEEDAFGRRNYSQADYINYRDGDQMSSINYNDGEGEEEGESNMYAQSEDDFASLINDEVRVYKGGSWKDRAYWLSPGTRRYLHQEESRDDIGFRCAMNRVGGSVTQ
ncbi:MAG: SUMF1/EgtB/PvdO family nonheme iron enzyme [Bacteroidales bacterium]